MTKKNGQLTEGSKPARAPRSAEQAARHKAIRERFQREKPSLEELVSSGEYNEPLPMDEYLSIRQAIFALKAAREAAGLSLADVAERTGIDKGALSRIETGQHLNPTISTLPLRPRAQQEVGMGTGGRGRDAMRRRVAFRRTTCLPTTKPFLLTSPILISYKRYELINFNSETV